MSDSISVVVPARNEAETIASVIRYLTSEPAVDEVIVVNNNSTDETAEIAKTEGATVVNETRQGMGHAFKAGCAVARNDWVMKVDADLDRFEPGLVPRLADGRAPGVGLIKGAWQDPADSMPMTRLLVKPAVLAMCPGLAHLRAPNSGIYLLNKSCIAHAEMTGDYAVDIDAMMRVYSVGLDIAEVDIGEIDNDPRDVGHYSAMAAQIMRYFLDRNAEDASEATIVFARNAQEVITGCLGLIGRRAIADAQVVVFMENTGDEAATVLKNVLRPYPSVKIRSGTEINTYDPHSIVGKARLIALKPASHYNMLFASALSLLTKLGPEVAHPEIWLMADDGTADTSVDVAGGKQIRDQALTALGILEQQKAPRELFLSHGAWDVEQKVLTKL